VSGVGKTRSAIATTLLLGTEADLDGALAVNVGIAGSIDGGEVHELFAINKVTDAGSGRRYYPDQIVQHGLNQAALETFDRPFDRRGAPRGEEQANCEQTPAAASTEEAPFPIAPVTSSLIAGTPRLADMEGAGFFQAAASFLGPHQIALMKIVSDRCEAETLAAAQVTAMIIGASPALFRALDRLDAHATARGVLDAAQMEELCELRGRLSLTGEQWRVLITVVTATHREGRDLRAGLAGLPREIRSHQHRTAVFRELLATLRNDDLAAES
jgi:nucleoside phosphorylase